MNRKLTFLNTDYSLSKMLVAGIILTLIYVFAGIITFNNYIIEPWNRIIYAVIAIIVALGCLHYSKTAKVLNVHVKQGKFKIYTIIICLLLIWIYGVKSLEWIAVFKQSGVEILTCFFTALAAGICEEFLFRNLFFNFFIGVYKNKKHILFLATITSSFFFALMHLVNLYHQNINTTIQQVCLVFCIGIIFCIFHILSNAMWLPVLMHFLFDFSPLMKNGVSQGEAWLVIIIDVIILLAVYLDWLWIFNKKLDQE